jgi:hypothetical protein
MATSLVFRYREINVPKLAALDSKSLSGDS